MASLGDRPQPRRNIWRLSPLQGLLLLSLLWALGALRSSLLPSLNPGALPFFERQALPLFVFAVIAVPFSILRKEARPSPTQMSLAIPIGLGLFTLPSILLHLAAPWQPPLARTALFTLVPVFALVLEPYIGRDIALSGATRNPGWMPATLAAVMGALCVFPVSIPAAWQQFLAFGLVILAAGCVAAANCLAVRAACEIPAGSLAPLAAAPSAIAALGLAAASATAEQPVFQLDRLAPELLWSLVIEVPALALLFWLMRRMSAVRMTARFVLAPFAALVVSLLIARPPMPLRGWLGLLLMAAGAAYMLLAPDQSTEAHGLSLK